MAKTYYHQYTVEGVYPFPVDMLRYDASIPASEKDSGLIGRTMDGWSRHKDGPTQITLTHCGDRARWTPTVGRWESFSWKVLPGTTLVREY